MIQIKDSERLVSLADLYSLRHVNWSWTRRVLSIYDCYIGQERLPSLRFDDCPLKNLWAQLEEGWVGALLLDGPKQALVGITLGRVEYYLDSVSVYVTIEAARITRPHDIQHSHRRFVCLRQAMLRQVLWHHLLYGEELHRNSQPRQRYTIYRRWQFGATTECYEWDPVHQQLNKKA